ILSSKKLYQRHLFTSKNIPLREAIAKQAEALQEIEQTIPALHGETEDEEKLAKVLTPDSTEEDIDAYLMESSLKKHSEQPLKTLSFTARENIIKQLTTISNVKLKDIMEKTESVVTSPEVRQEVEKKKQEIWQRIEEQRKKLKNTRISSKDWMPGYSGGGRDSNYSPIHPSRRGGRNGGYQDYGDDYEDWQDIPEDNSPTTGTSDNAPYWGGDKKADDAETIPLNELIQSLLENDNIKTIIKIGKSDFWFQPEAEYFPGITLAITSINFARLTEDIIAAEQRLYRKKIKDKLDKKAGKKAKKKAADNVDARVIAKYEQLLKNLVPGIVKMYYHCETNFMPLILEGGNTKILRTIPWREESTDTLKLIKNIFESKQQFNEKGLAAFNKKLVETIQKTLEDNQKKITQLQKFAETVEQQLGGSKNSTDKFTAETFNTKLQAFENARFQSVFAIIKNGIAKLDPKFASVIKELEQISQINNKESGEERRKAALKTVVEKHQRTVYKNVLATCQAFTNIGFDIRLLYPTKITNKVHFTAEKGSKAFIDYYLQEAEKKLRQLH
ncbi:hypothetical protein KAU11_05590, partial [Candidatus Babeliales bacterium]|nr:hypothetical protein [Candidatus Babeliales bacterium]